MARIFHDGYETGTGTPLGNYTSTAGKHGNGTDCQVHADAARSGALGLRVRLTASGAQCYAHPFHGANGTRNNYARFYLRVVAAPGSASNVFQFGQAGDVSLLVVGIRLNTDRTLNLVDEDGVIGSASSALTLDTWYRVEVRVNTTTASGSHEAEAKIDGTTFASSTTRAITATIQGVRAGANVGGSSASATSGDWDIDDVAVNDTTGSAQTSWPGEGSLVLLNVSADGTTTNRGTQATHWQTGPTTGQTALAQVDEGNAPDDATSYIALLDTSASTSDSPVMLFTVSSPTTAGIGASDTITLCSVHCRKNAASNAANRYHAVLKSGASYLDGAQRVMAGASWAWDSDTNGLPIFSNCIAYTDPNTGSAWTRTNLAAAEMGFRAGSDVNPNPWISWVGLYVEFVPTAGGSTFFITPAGTVTPAGALSSAVTTTKTGTITPAGALAKAAAKPFAGSSSPAGALLNQAQKVFAGTVTPAAVLETIRAVLRTFTGTITPAATMTKSVDAPKAGTITPAGALSRATSKPLAGTVTPGGALAKLVAKVFGGSSSPAGALTAVKVALASYAGTITPAGAVRKAVEATKSGSTAPGGTLTRATAATKSGTIAPAGALAKLIAKIFGGSTTPTGSFTGEAGTGITIGGTITPAGALRRSSTKAAAGTLTPSAALSRATSARYAGTIAPAGELSRAVPFLRAFAGVLTPIGTLTTAIGGVLGAVIKAVALRLGGRRVAARLGGRREATRLGGRRSADPVED